MQGTKTKIDTSFVSKPIVRKWPSEFYWELENEENEHECVFLSRVRYMNGKPMMVEETYFSEEAVPDFCNTPFINRSLFDTLLTNYRIEVKDVHQKFRAISAKGEVARALEMEEGSPVLKMLRKLRSNRAGFNIYSFIYCNTADFTIEA